VQVPVEVTIKNGAKTDLNLLKDLLKDFGDMVGDFQPVYHTSRAENEEDAEFVKVLIKFGMGKLSFTSNFKGNSPRWFL
ncbi:Hypothetical protein FKW44_010405, partial [Caligus rogercresseyi]